MQPTTDVCEFCGAKLEPIMMKIGDHVHTLGYGPCHCEQAAKKREENLRAENEEKAAKARDQLMQRMARAGVPERYRDAYHPMAQEKADAILKTNRGLWIYGPQGTNKTLLMCSISRILIGRGIPLKFVVSTKLADAMRSREAEDREYIKTVSSVRVLAIDDLDKVNPTQHACERFWELFNDRYNANLPTLCTANIERGAIIPKFQAGETGKAIASRLAEMTESLYMGGADRRLQNA